MPEKFSTKYSLPPKNETGRKVVRWFFDLNRMAFDKLVLSCKRVGENEYFFLGRKQIPSSLLFKNKFLAIKAAQDDFTNRIKEHRKALSKLEKLKKKIDQVYLSHISS